MLKRSFLTSSRCINCLRTSSTLPAKRTYSIALAEFHSQDPIETSTKSIPDFVDVKAILPDSINDKQKSNATLDHEHAIRVLERRASWASRNKSDELLACSTTAIAILESLHSQNRHPSRKAVQSLLAITCLAGVHSHVNIVLDLFKRYWIPLRDSSVLHLTRFYADAGEPEQCLAFLEVQIKAGITIPVLAWQELISLYFRIDEHDAALEAIQKSESLAQRNQNVRLFPSFYFHSLSQFARIYHTEGIQYIWQKAIATGILSSLDVGLCTNILNACARRGLPILATDVMNYLARQKSPAKGYHYASLIQSYCRAGDVRTAFKILAIMRAEGVPPTNMTASSIVDAISTSLDLIDRAFFTLQDIKADGGTVDVSAFNAVLDACIIRKDLSRAIATYEDYESLGVTPDIDTLNTLLTGCVGNYNKDLALVLVDTFSKSHSIVPDLTTYHNLMAVCILQQNYEDVFKFLEQCKSAGHQPPASIYSTIYNRLKNEGDSRSEVAKAEASGWGYRIRDGKVDEYSTGVWGRLSSMTDSKNFKQR